MNDAYEGIGRHVLVLGFKRQLHRVIVMRYIVSDALPNVSTIIFKNLMIQPGLPILEH